MEVGSEQAIRAGRVLLDLDYQVLVSSRPGVLVQQKECVEDALLRNKDVLFVPACEVTDFVGRV
jgi:hypothetical protein